MQTLMMKMFKCAYHMNTFNFSETKSLSNENLI